ncbi:MAG: DUF721 domain-containing protein [Alphaproteobacteria bacterium]
MRPVSEATAKVTNQVFGRKYIALGRIVTQWPEIVGADLATKAQPAGLQYRRFKNSKTPDAVLEIATTSAYATRLHYQKDLILERLNQLFGEKWISAIKFVNVPSNQSAAPKIQKRPLLSSDDENYIKQSLDLITDIDVRNTLEQFGKSLLIDKKAKEQ